MKEFKGTKGDWELVEHSWSDTSIICRDKTICTKSIYDECTEETQEEVEAETSANFKLIVASKELLEALKELVEVLGEDWDKNLSYIKAIEAINKALDY
jgi:hypothetical protein